VSPINRVILALVVILVGTSSIGWNAIKSFSDLLNKNHWPAAIERDLRNSKNPVTHGLSQRLIPLDTSFKLAIGIEFLPRQKARATEIWMSLHPRPQTEIVGGLWIISLIGLFILIFKPKPRAQIYKDKWATPNDLKSLIATIDASKATHALKLAHVVGEKYVHTLRTKETPNAIFVGQPGCGKSVGLVLNLMYWQDSAVVVDIKAAELWKLTARAKQEQGHRILVLDPSGVGDQFDPFSALGTSDEALATMANVMLNPTQDGESVFGERGQNFLIAAMQTAIHQGAPVLPFLKHATNLGLKGCIKFVLEQAENQTVITNRITRFLGRDWEETDDRILENKFLQSSYETFTARLEPLLYDGVAKMLSGSTFTAQDLRQKPCVLYLRFPQRISAGTTKSFELVMFALTQMLSIPPKSGERRVLMAVDEAGAIAIPKLSESINQLRSAQVPFWLYLQNLGQLETRYGRTQAKEILGACRAKTFWATDDQDTADWISNRAGHTEVEVQQRTAGKNERQQDVPRTYVKRELITSSEVAQLDDQVVIFYEKFSIKVKPVSFLTHFGDRWTPTELKPCAPTKPVTWKPRASNSKPPGYSSPDDTNS
jgi:type IV secretory pathway TraG/TraD family ATPase VirD4